MGQIFIHFPHECLFTTGIYQHFTANIAKTYLAEGSVVTPNATSSSGELANDHPKLEGVVPDFPLKPELYDALWPCSHLGSSSKFYFRYFLSHRLSFTPRRSSDAGGAPGVLSEERLDVWVNLGKIL